MLRNDYYIGTVTLRGVKRPGIHPPLVDRATFDRVQKVLDAHTLAGDRTRKHSHYLRGQLFCGSCGSRLVFGRHQGNGGLYEYFGCLAKQRGVSCEGERYRAVGDVEKAVGAVYDGFEMSEAERDQVARVLQDRIASRSEIAQAHANRHATRLRQLLDEEKRLLQLHLQGGVSPELMAAEQQRIVRERAEARKWSQAATEDAQDLVEVMDTALDLLKAPAQAYANSAPLNRRLMNGAFFDRLTIREEEVAEADAVPVIRTMVELARAVRESDVPDEDECDRDPGSLEGLGSNNVTLVQKDRHERQRTYVAKAVPAQLALEAPDALVELGRDLLKLPAGRATWRSIAGCRTASHSIPFLRIVLAEWYVHAAGSGKRDVLEPHSSGPQTTNRSPRFARGS